MLIYFRGYWYRHDLIYNICEYSDEENNINFIDAPHRLRGLQNPVGIKRIVDVGGYAVLPRGVCET